MSRKKLPQPELTFSKSMKLKKWTLRSVTSDICLCDLHKSHNYLVHPLLYKARKSVVMSPSLADGWDYYGRASQTSSCFSYYYLRDSLFALDFLWCLNQGSPGPNLLRWGLGLQRSPCAGRKSTLTVTSSSYLE